MLALIACHNTGEQPPGNLMPELAETMGPGRAPRPHFVFMALIAELEARSLQDAVER